VVCGLALLAFCPALRAQVRVGVQASAQTSDSLSVQINSGSGLSISSLTPGAVNSFSGGPVNVTTSWTSLKNGRTVVNLYAYFVSATSALVHTDSQNTTDIPSAAVKVRMNGFGAYNPLSSATPFSASASGLLLFSQSINGTNKTSSRSDTIELQLDLSGPANGQDMTQLPADTYTGTLRIQAQATP
jgi:hypothetical protein